MSVILLMEDVINTVSILLVLITVNASLATTLTQISNRV